MDASVFISLPELDFRSDPIDEIIAATSIAHSVPLLTRDKKILQSKVVPLAV
jgi:PIN domain nuclease of toxin-antitoxin system